MLLGWFPTRFVCGTLPVCFFFFGTCVCLCAFILSERVNRFRGECLQYASLVLFSCVFLLLILPNSQLDVLKRQSLGGGPSAIQSARGLDPSSASQYHASAHHSHFGAASLMLSPTTALQQHKQQQQQQQQQHQQQQHSISTTASVLNSARLRVRRWRRNTHARAEWIDLNIFFRSCRYSH
jgi:hypothetical protein